MSQASKHLYVFGPFRLIPGEWLLLRDGVPVPLTPKVFETLLALVENAGHAMEKDDLLKRVWPDTFVEEATLAKNISTLRKALGEGEGGAEYIETLPKHGYRFVAAVQRIEDTAAGDGPGGTETFAGAARGNRAKYAVAAIAVVSVALGVALVAWEWLRPRATPPVSKVKLAVLPFENLSGDESQEYIADGLTEEVIARLSNLNPQGLAVIARTSTMKYKGSDKDIAGISRELGVDYVLESSFRREGDRVRVTAQLIQSSDQTHLWAETYEREVGQILPLQSELTETIARQMRVVLPEAKSQTASLAPLNLEAHLLYLKGRYYWNKRTPDGLKQATDYYQQALDLDPNYARAWAGLATVYALLDEYQVLPAREAYLRAKAAASRALELDPAQVEARAARALVRGWYDWDAPGAEQDFKQAIAINPNYSVARHWYGMLLMADGRFEEARQEFERALLSDPLSNSIPVAIGASYYHARQFDQAIAQYLRAVESQPRSAGVRFHLGRAYARKGMHKEAVEQFETGAQLTGSGEGSASLAYGYAAAGRKKDALRTLEELKRATRGAYSPYYVAAVYVELGDTTRAIEELERAFQQRLGRLTFLKVEPMFDPIRNDPRFKELLKRIAPQA
ncbi:MAG: tetratricopeptide repeat protein [Acidobacteria bacterium]|nr:tetratricopeptide repeat protein [Acidobacteriota bacterium]MCL5287574.1 tetratricopeptide repeat protein [Acidobacteriota bacterium]